MSGNTPVLVLIANHEGDVINNGSAVDMARDDELVIGPGVHGEAGPERPIKVTIADAVMDIVAQRVLEDGDSHIPAILSGLEGRIIHEKVSASDTD